jgi:broad specificity phosphatase PhoE
VREPLYFIRHGETDWNREGRLQGHTETSLNARGERQAVMAAQNLKALLGGADPAGFTFHCSPMRRARQTMERARAALGLPPEDYLADDRLREIAFGAWEGRTWPEIRTRDPIGATTRDKDLWAFAPPGGESYADVARRVESWLAGIERPAIVVSHGGIGRTLMVLHGLDRGPALEASVWQGKVLRLKRGVAEWLPGAGHA